MVVSESTFSLSSAFCTPVLLTRLNIQTIRPSGFRDPCAFVGAYLVKLPPTRLIGPLLDQLRPRLRTRGGQSSRVNQFQSQRRGRHRVPRGGGEWFATISEPCGRLVVHSAGKCFLRTKKYLAAPRIEQVTLSLFEKAMSGKKVLVPVMISRIAFLQSQ